MLCLIEKWARKQMFKSHHLKSLFPKRSKVRQGSTLSISLLTTCLFPQQDFEYFSIHGFFPAFSRGILYLILHWYQLCGFNKLNIALTIITNPKPTDHVPRIYHCTEMSLIRTFCRGADYALFFLDQWWAGKWNLLLMGPRSSKM